MTKQELQTIAIQNTGEWKLIKTDNYKKQLKMRQNIPCLSDLFQAFVFWEPEFLPSKKYWSLYQFYQPAASEP